jgi:hypothetical protein
MPAGLAIEVFTYRPPRYRDGPLILVFHGVLRNAETYRDHAREMGERFGALIAAPLFDETRFPTSKYQQGGVLLDGVAQPRDSWTFALVPQTVDELRGFAGRPNLDYYLIGHSGGGQFLARLAGFQTVDARRIVSANPGTYLFPNTEHEFPLGFGNLPAEFADNAALKRYLAQPLTIYLGTSDTVRDDNLDQSSAADRQGMCRYERGRRAYFRAADLARERGWPFRWRLTEAPEVPHDHEKMFNHERCREALFGPEGARRE